MYLKKKLMKAAAVCSYVFTGLWMIAAACNFALSGSLYILFALFAFITLINGFVITDICQKMTAVQMEKGEPPQDRHDSPRVSGISSIPPKPRNE